MSRAGTLARAALVAGALALMAPVVALAQTGTDGSITELRATADGGLAQAQFTLAQLYDAGAEVPRNYAEAARWYRAAAEQGHIAAQNRLGQYLHAGLGIARDPQAALEWLRRAADAGQDPAHGVDLGRALEDGGGFAAAAEAYAKAAQAGSFDAAVSLGVLYQEGRGVTQDFARALELYGPAAEAGHPRAMNNLGLLLVRGDGTEQDYARATALFRAAAEAGLKPAMTNLGVMYENGFGIAQSDALATEWYRRAGRLGQLPGDAGPALLYDPRLVPPVMTPDARAALERGASGGDPVDQFMFAYLILTAPQSAPSDIRRAALLMQSAAEVGHVPAMANLGLLYFRGHGLPQDFLLGYQWLTLASGSGLSGADDIIAAYAHRMTPALITEAQARSAGIWAEFRGKPKN